MSITSTSSSDNTLDERTAIGQSPSSSPSSTKAPAIRSRRSLRRTALMMGAVVFALVATACFPTGPVADWVPDTNGDGAICQSEIDARKSAILAEITAAVEAHRREVQLNSVLVCIRQHESDRGEYPHTNGYASKNGRSTASGAYQFLNGTWRNVSAAAGYPGYSQARYAPWHIQDAVALWVIENQGKSAWRGSGC